MQKLIVILMAAALCMACTPSQQAPSALDYVRELSSDKYAGRKTGTEGSRLAAHYIAGQFERIGMKGYTQDFRHPFQFAAPGGHGVATGVNLLGYIPGTAADSQSKVIVISAHYDHLGVMNGQIYNGADDNASGVGGLLMAARAFKAQPPAHTLIFAAFDAEELGLQGAKAFVAAPPVPLKSIVLDINMDMLAHNDKGELYVAGLHYHPQLRPFLPTNIPGLRLLAGHDDPALGARDDWTGQSDQGAFHALNIAFLYFGVEDHKDYHRPTDDFDTINPVFYGKAVDAVIQAARRIDQGI